MYLITSYDRAENDIGKKADKNRKIYNLSVSYTHLLAMLCTLLLIFSMGVMLGQKENFLSELSSLGPVSYTHLPSKSLASSFPA